MAEKIIVDLEIDSSKLNKDIAESTKRVKELKDQIKELTEAEGDNAEQIAELTVVLQAEQAEQRKRVNFAKTVYQAEQAKTGSINELRAALKLVTTEWAELSEEERRNTTEGKLLVQQKLLLTEALKAEELATGDARRTVGNYVASIEEALAASDQFGGGLGALREKGEQLKAGLKALASSPLLLAFTALAAAAAALFKAFTRTQEGTDKMAKITATLSAVMDVLTGVLGNVANAIFDAFAEPKKTLKDFATSIKTFVSDKIEALLDTVGLLGSAVKKAFSLDFKGAAEDAGKAASKFVDELTPVGVIKDVVKETAEGFDELGKSIDAATASAAKLSALQKQLENQNIRSATVLASLNAELAKQTSLRDTDTQSLQKQYDAAEQVLLLTKESYDEQLKTAKLEAAVAQERLRQAKASGVASREQAQAAADASAKIISLEGEQTAALLDATQARDMIKRDQIEQDLDVLIDFNETQVGLNKTLFDAEKKDFEKKAALVSLTKKLNEEIFNEQIKSVEELGKKNVDVNALVSESNAKVFNAKLKELELSEIGNARLLEVITKRKQQLQDEADLTTKLAEDKAKAEADALTAKADAEAKAAETAKEAKLLENENRLALIKGNLFAELDLQREQLAEKERLEIESAQKLGLSTTNIAAKYSKAKKEIDKAEFNAKLSLANDFAGNLAQIAGEQTAVGKAAAVAQTAISTYQSATSAYGSLAPIPIVGPALGAVAAGAAVVAGLANVKKILSVKSGLPGESSGSSSVPSAGSAPSAPSAPSSVAPSVNQGIVSRSTDNIGASTPAAIVTTVVDQVTSAQNAQSNIAEAGTL